MNRKKNNDRNGFVYSTDPNFRFEEEPAADNETLPAAQQNLRVLLDKKQRAGKAVTLVTGFVGQAADLDDLGKAVKQFCGTGGAVKEGEIIVQGDQRDKVLAFLLKQGYSKTKKIG
ncbi:MAG: translation initiation factor [Bacteroidetes bacterium]|nr:translation initiation factor [Bacteroidota bacterium]HOA39497.1 translation initiation factor [Flavihumibacter sp.]